MKHWGVERRRMPRVKPRTTPDDDAVALLGSCTVRLLDFSESGVLVASKVDLAEGERAELRAIGAEGPVCVPVEIRHVSSRTIARVGPRCCAGAAFLHPSVEQRQQLATVFRAERP